MALVYIGYNAPKHFSRLFNNAFYDLNSFAKRNSSQTNQTELIFFSGTPVISDNGSYQEYKFKQTNDLEKIISDAQNNFAAMRIFKVDDKDFITISSCRFARARIYFTRADKGFYFSDDLRELLPFSNRQMSELAAYSIIKYGNTPEYITIVEDIFAVPVSSFLTIEINKLLEQDTIPFKDFKNYFKLYYEFEGSSLDATEKKLGKIMDYLVKKDIAVPISGGIDSSLINYMINERTDEKYPAYNLSFGENDTELPFVNESVKNTKADLDVITMLPKDFCKAFDYQAKNLIQPVGESSPISMANLFINKRFNENTILDGTLADGCYGSRNYSQPFVSSSKSYSNRQLKINEKISAFLVLNNLPLKDKFYPADSFVNDNFFQQIAVYIGSLSNTIFRSAKTYNKDLGEYWNYYYDLIEAKDNADNYWMKYSIFKMINYASNTTIAKTYDLCGINNYMEYPFMWKDILIDQGKYTWEEKTKDNIIKYPLKKLIEKYASHDFIYRRKVGLHSSMENWFSYPDNKKFLSDFSNKSNSVSRKMIGNRNTRKLLKTFNSANSHRFVLQLVLSFAMIQAWCDRNNVKT